jgi:hypothetical protein
MSVSFKICPASKSIQFLLLLNNSELDEILTVGTGAPRGVPLPVVNRMRCAPAAVRAVDDTISFPGA